VVTGTAGVAATKTINTDLVVTADTAGLAGSGITVSLTSDAATNVTESSIVTFTAGAATPGETQVVNGVTAATDGLFVTTANEMAAGFADYIANGTASFVSAAGATVSFTGVNDGTLFTAAGAAAGATLTYTSATANADVTDIVIGGTAVAPVTEVTTDGSAEIATSTTVVGNAITIAASSTTIAAWTNADVAALLDGLETTTAGTITATGGVTAAAAFANTNLAGGVDESGDYDAGTATVTVDNLSVATASDSQSAIASVDLALKDIATIRGGLGAVQNRFESTIANLMSASENISAARSGILDADFAAETAELTKSQILQQAGLAMLSQANQIPQAALTLLQG
jgi:flagellin